MSNAGKHSMNTRNGRIQFEESNNRIVAKSDAGITRLIIDMEGIQYYDEDGNLQRISSGPNELKFRPDGTAYYISGTLPNDEKGDVYVKEGYDARDASIYL